MVEVVEVEEAVEEAGEEAAEEEAGLVEVDGVSPAVEVDGVSRAVEVRADLVEKSRAVLSPRLPSLVSESGEPTRSESLLESIAVGLGAGHMVTA